MAAQQPYSLSFSKENKLFKLYAIWLAFKDHGINFMAGWFEIFLKFPLHVSTKLQGKLWTSFSVSINSSWFHLPSYAFNLCSFISVHCWYDCPATWRAFCMWRGLSLRLHFQSTSITPLQVFCLIPKDYLTPVALWFPQYIQTPGATFCVLYSPVLLYF